MPAKYTTASDERWDAIAKTALGSEAYVTDLMRANPEYLDYYALPAGAVLTLPDIAQEPDPALPAWRREA